VVRAADAQDAARELPLLGEFVGLGAADAKGAGGVVRSTTVGRAWSWSRVSGFMAIFPQWTFCRVVLCRPVSLHGCRAHQHKS
jgi:hypothetical protein